MPIATIADRYEIVQQLGRGGMGYVWLADDTVLGRQVALKFVDNRDLLANPSANSILEDEARTAGRLVEFPQVVTTLDLLTSQSDFHSGPVMVMEYVDGGNLAEWITQHRGRLDAGSQTYLGLYLSLEATEAISYAHKMGILHRDIKPQNILNSRLGRVKVADFGLARVVEEITRSHTVWAHHTPLYSAPEQWEDQRPDTRTDVYQLCASIYHLLTGQPANEGSTLIQLMKWHQDGGIAKPLTNFLPELHPDVVEIVHEGLSKDPTARPDPWQIFDAISGAIMHPVTVGFEIPNFSDSDRKALAKLLDFEETAFLRNGKLVPAKVGYPNPLEGLRMANAVVVRGGKCTIEKSATETKVSVPGT